ncbi:MAG: tetratricopeptide repeat protein [Gammaproteobacteria bacterium]|nr:tetratricopeptide repeat protein [Gammaproteobacteria bacterium]MBU1776374.1 tetratricopeptide repeat protein [Gammaproteobacteria bacterium]MBU1969577.1 tetratricopeptide repeat protein [Gammaproteobacteria bacterium]
MNSSLRLLILSVTTTLAACATAPQQELAEAPHHAGRTDLEQIVEPGKLDLPNVELTDRLLYEFLLGDIAAQRDRPELAAQAYLDLARTTRDPRVARRAAQLAYESRQLEQAVEAFKLWQELEPSSPLAKQMLLSLLLSGGNLQEARPHLETILKADPANAGRTFLNIYPLASRSPDKAAVLDWMMEATRPYQNVAEGHWAVAQAAAAAGKHDLALAEAHRAAALKPDWAAAAVYEAELTMRNEPQRGLDMLKRYLKAHPENADLRLYYARALLSQKQYAVARDEFQRLLKDRPDNPDLAFAIALISMQMGDYARAEQELQQSLAKGGKEESAVHHYLGQLNEARKNDAAALEHYRQVKGGEYAYAARLREVALLDKAGKLDEARAVLHSAVPTTDQQRVQLILIDAQLLREGKQYEVGYKVLAQGLEKYPANPDLLYQTAMAAEKLKKNELFEQLIRKLIKLEPDNAHAYNALGYSLLERNVRLPEAMKLVEKAYQLAPEDAAIIDSMGWGHYLLGDLGKSVEFLRRAFSANPDPEIAAHLGEVLWKQGDHEGARKVWDEGVKANPDHEVLKAIIKRFIP